MSFDLKEDQLGGWSRSEVPGLRQSCVWDLGQADLFSDQHATRRTTGVILLGGKILVAFGMPIGDKDGFTEGEGAREGDRL